MFNRKVVLTLCSSLMALLSAITTFANSLPDYYNEPGYSTKHGFQVGENGETIDPFSGKIKFHHVDMYVPTNGGLDIVINRTYSSLNGTLEGIDTTAGSAIGVGWKMHFGRIFKSSNMPCNYAYGQNDVDDMPYLEMADGSIQSMFQNDKDYQSLAQGYEYVTSQRWKVDCSNSNSIAYRVISTEGAVYEFGKKGKGEQYWYVTKITDLNGNQLEIYYQDKAYKTVILSVTANKNTSNRQTVKFEYYDIDTQTPRLKRVYHQEDPSNSVSYSYQQVEGLLVTKHFLEKVISPEASLTWDYEYNKTNEQATASSDDGAMTAMGASVCMGGCPKGDGGGFIGSVGGGSGGSSGGGSSTCIGDDCPEGDGGGFTGSVGGSGSNASGSAGQYSIRKVVHPNGNDVVYTYKKMQFMQGIVGIYDSNDVINQKLIGNKTWNYDYDVTSTEDITTITQPDNTKIVYRHWGLNSTSSGSIWKVGSQKSISHYNANGYEAQKVIFEWQSQKMSSTDNYRESRVKLHFHDSETYIPILKKKTIVRDGKTYVTDFLDYDVHGNYKRVNENSSGNYRTKRYVYDTSLISSWLLHLVKEEKVDDLAGNNAIARTYYISGASKGKLKSESSFGITTYYQYHSNGELYKQTDANGYVTIFSDYYCGVPRTEVRPVNASKNITVTRVVNKDGTIQSETIKEYDGQNITTSFTYDKVNRISGIFPPEGYSVSIIYDKYKSVLTKGNYRLIKYFDGFGRVTRVNHKDIQNSPLSISTGTDYDVFGRQSYIYNPSASSSFSKYIKKDYDVLNRAVKVTHQDNSTTTTSFLNATNVVKIKDEEGKYTNYHYRSYGDPDEKQLIKIENLNANGSVANTTDIGRDKVGKIDWISQGGVTRDYNYYSTQLLQWINDPEIGKTEYQYDNVGNVRYKRVASTNASQWVEYQYDRQNRNTFINYPQSNGQVNSASDVTISYDNRNNVLDLITDEVSRSFNYTSNGQLDDESLSIDGQTFTVDYSYNNYGMLTALTYPQQGLLGTISYTPNVFGWETKVESASDVFASNITYHPSGQVYQMTLGNGRVSTQQLNDRLWVSNKSVSGIASIGYDYYHNGNVKSITGMPGGDITNLTYDAQQRLNTLNGPWGTSDIDYDNKGNITYKKVGSQTVNYQYSNNLLTAATQTDSGFNTNYSFNYDNYGNVTNDGTFSFKYDHAGNMIDLNGGNTVYVYDGMNMRVKKSAAGSADSYFFYTKGGTLIGEYSTSGKVKEFVVRGSATIAQIEMSLTINLPQTATNGNRDSDGNLEVSWADDSGASYYQVEISTDPNFESGVTSVYEGASNAAEINGLQDGSYYVRIRSCASSNTSTCDGWQVAEFPIVVARKWIPIASSDITIFVPLAD